MSIQDLGFEYRLVADLVARDRHGRIVLVVAIKPILEAESAWYGGPAVEIERYLKVASEPETAVPYVMLVFLDVILIYKVAERSGEAAAEPVLRLETVPVLEPYSQTVARKRIHKDLLGTLVGAWIHDLNYHWNSKRPPGSEDLESIGLRPRLEGGFTDYEVGLGLGPLP